VSDSLIPLRKIRTDLNQINSLADMKKFAASFKDNYISGRHAENHNTEGANTIKEIGTALNDFILNIENGLKGKLNSSDGTLISLEQLPIENQLIQQLKSLNEDITSSTLNNSDLTALNEQLVNQINSARKYKFEKNDTTKKQYDELNLEVVAIGKLIQQKEKALKDCNANYKYEVELLELKLKQLQENHEDEKQDLDAKLAQTEILTSDEEPPSSNHIHQLRKEALNAQHENDKFKAWWSTAPEILRDELNSGKNIKKIEGEFDNGISALQNSARYLTFNGVTISTEKRENLNALDQAICNFRNTRGKLSGSPQRQHRFDNRYTFLAYENKDKLEGFISSINKSLYYNLDKLLDTKPKNAPNQLTGSVQQL
jgi:hypothetical protein